VLDIRDEMAKAGVECDVHIECDGRIHRFKVPGSRKANGWYVLDRDGDKVYGAFGDWKSGISHTVGKQTAKIREVRAARKVDTGARAEKAKRRAQTEWDAAKGCWVIRDANPYLVRKGIAAVQVRRRGQDLLVPMFRDGWLVGLQTIRPDGDKRYTPGMKKLGASLWLNGTGNVVVLCEGYATGASINAATRLPVVVAFDSGNLLPAACAIPPGMVGKWIVAGDNDHETVCPRHKKGGHMFPLDPVIHAPRPDWCRCNPGKTEAMRVADELHAKLALPCFIRGTDFNDMHLALGLSAVADAIYRCI